MLASTFNSYLALATVFSCVASAPVSNIRTQNLLKRNAALDAANAAQSGITALVCKLSYQTKSAAYALGIGSAPVACTSSSTSSTSSTVAVAAVAEPAVVTQVATPLSVAVPVVVHPVAVIPAVVAAPVVVATPSMTSPCTSSDATVCAMQAQALLAHNTARVAHHALPLVWNDTLAEGAMRWAKNAQWKHSGGSLFPFVYGENLYASTLASPGTTVSDGVNAFLAEESAYDYNNPGFSEATGHFTQVVWASTQQVGCVLVNVNLDIFTKYTDSSAYMVCEYFPAGNYLTLFAENVLRP